MPPFIREDPGNGWSHSHGWWKDDCDNPPHETRLKRGLAPGRFIGSKRGHTNTSGDLSLTRVMPIYVTRLFCFVRRRMNRYVFNLGIRELAIDEYGSHDRLDFEPMGF